MIHRSTTDADARLYRKGDGQASRLCHMAALAFLTKLAAELRRTAWGQPNKTRSAASIAVSSQRP